MARKPRVEVEGGLYHITARGNNRRRIFDDDEDYRKLLKLLTETKTKLPFYLYAYCFMPNHVHLLVERRQDAICRVMHRLLTGYSRYYNRRYRRVGHLFQKRYKAILCQTDQYLAELVRYIHLNPVRARMVSNPASYPYSSHRVYLGLDEPRLVDIEPVLRHFGGTKRLARERFELFVKAGTKDGHRAEFYKAAEGKILGSDEFVEATKKRVGEVGKGGQLQIKSRTARDLEALIEAVEKASGFTPEEICSQRKKRAIVMAKEALIIVGEEFGGSHAALARLIGIDSSVVSRRSESGKTRMNGCREMQELVNEVRELCRKERSEN